MCGKLVGKTIIILMVFGLFISLGPRNTLAAERPFIKQEDLNKAIQLHIEKNMPWQAGSMRFEVLSRLPEIVMPAGHSSWKLDTKENENYLGESYIILKLYNSGVLFREESIKVRIEILREFVVAVNSLARNSIITASDVAIQKKWVRSIPLNVISSINEVAGKSLCVSIRPNTEISHNMIKEVTAVKRGKMVQVILDNGAINITTMGLSEEDGAEGSFVKVRNISSNKIIYARVVGESRVKVDF
jgi:flagellar basal body P-ring formation protein FlgA